MTPKIVRNSFDLRRQGKGFRPSPPTRRAWTPGRLCPLPGLIVLVLASYASGQARSVLDALGEKLRAASFIPDSDRKTIQSAVDDQVKVLLDENVDLEFKRKIRDDFRKLLGKESSPSAQFKERFVSAVVDAFKTHLKDGDPNGVLIMVMILYDVRDDLPIATFREGGVPDAMVHPSPAVRYWVARIIRSRQKAIGELQAVRVVALSALRQAAAQEASEPALRELYQALDFTLAADNRVPPFAEDLVRTFVDVLEARAKQYLAGTLSPSEAEVTAIDGMEHLTKDLNVESQLPLCRRYLTALAQMLYRTVDRYVAELRDEAPRRDMALLRRSLILVRRIDVEFGRFVRAAGVRAATPSVYTKMQTPNEEAVLAERNKWCGWPPNDRGLLNAKPFDLPLGAGFAEAAASQSAESQPTTR